MLQFHHHETHTHTYLHTILKWLHAHVRILPSTPKLLKCLFPKGESSLELVALCHVGTGSLSRRTNTLFTPAPKKGKSSYLSGWMHLVRATLQVDDIIARIT